MPGFGFGFGLTSSKNARGNGGGPHSPVLPVLQPAEDWDGSPGTGFANAPIDPLRNTAKPAMRLLVPPKQFFTDRCLVGVAAMANDNGSMLNKLGLEKVIVHYEGSTAEISAPSSPTFDDANGMPVSYHGWWAELSFDGREGEAELYFEAVPSDSSMQNRIIGPYTFNPAVQMHDLELHVVPSSPEIAGLQYQTLYGATLYAKQQRMQNPLIVIDEAGIYDIGDQFYSHWGMRGYCNIEASVPDVRIGKPGGYVSDVATKLDPNRMPLHIKGGNIALDFAFMRLETAATVGLADHWLDGCDMINRNGRDGLVRGGPNTDVAYTIRGNPWMTEVNASDVHFAATGANLARGCLFSRAAQDIVTGGNCIIDCDIQDHSNAEWNTHYPAFTVEYTGPEPTATLSRSGGTEGHWPSGPGGTGGQYTASWGNSTAVFNVGNGTEDFYTGTKGDGYWFADVVDWLNTLPDWSATLSAEMTAADRRACTGELDGTKGQGFGGGGNSGMPADVKTAALTIYSFFDKHGDFYQHAAGHKENVIVANNTLYGADVQAIFLSPINNGSGRDMMFVNNIFMLDPTDGAPLIAASQLGRTNVSHGHVVIAHNSFVDQELWFRTDNAGYDIDSYCLVANNVLPSVKWIGGTPDPDLVLADNHLFAGAVDPANATGTTVGGTYATLFEDALAGNFTPAAELLSAEGKPVVKLDNAGSDRGNRSSPGAVAS